MIPILLFLLPVLQTTGQVSNERIKVEVNLVLVDVQVVERSTGRVISGLEKSDFVVKDDDHAKDIAVFEREKAPLDIVFLLDTSAGWVGAHAPELGQGSLMVVRTLGQGDRLGVISFASGVKLKTRLTGDEKAALNAVASALRERDHRAEHPHIYKALIAATDLFPKPGPEPRRRAILIVTHNREPASPSQVEAATSSLLEARVSLEGLIVPQKVYLGPGFRSGIRVLIPGRGRRDIPRDDPNVDVATLSDLHSIDAVAQATGGEVLQYSSESQAWWQTTIERLRSRYLLGFYAGSTANKKGAFSSIAVDLTEKAKTLHPDAIVRAPRGYYVN
jgi:VWFA-related protein